MIRRDRANREIDPQWFAKAVDLADRAFPGLVDTATIRSLLPHLRSVWRRGGSAREAIALLCSDGRNVAPSPGQSLLERRVRPPKGATPGAVFGPGDLLLPKAADRARRAAEKADKKAQDADEKRAMLEAQRFDGRKKSPERIARLHVKIETLRQEARTAEREADRLRAEARTLSTPISDPWTKIAPERSKKPRSAAGLGQCPPLVSGCSLGLLGAICGLPASLVVAGANGRPTPQAARFCLTSADRLIPSHDARRGFARRRDYPVNVQEREYHRQQPEQYKVISTAQNLIPELIFNGSPGAIDGLPVVTSDGIVLGGNGRTMALQLHYSQGGTVAKDYLLDHAGGFGFTRDQVSKLADPVVVRVVSTFPTDDPRFVRQAQELVRLLNVPLSQLLETRAESVAEGRRITDEILEILSVALSGVDSSLSEYLDSRASRTLINALTRAGILTDRNRDRYYDGEKFTADGKKYLERILLGAILPDAELIDRLGPGVVGTLAGGAPWILGAASNGPDWDLRLVLADVAEDFLTYRQTNAKSADAFYRQTTLGERPKTEDNPISTRLFGLLVSSSNKPKIFKNTMRRFAALAATSNQAQTGLFGGDSLTPNRALELAGQEQ